MVEDLKKLTTAQVGGYLRAIIERYKLSPVKITHFPQVPGREFAKIFRSEDTLFISWNNSYQQHRMAAPVVLQDICGSVVSAMSKVSEPSLVLRK